MQGSDGYFYGTTAGGGTRYAGTVFKISTNGVLTVCIPSPAALMAIDPASHLCKAAMAISMERLHTAGLTQINMAKAGTVFKISTNGILTSLYSFTGGNEGWFLSL